MSWNYRVVKEPREENADGVMYLVQEVYYDGQNRPYAYAPAALMSETRKGLEWVADRIIGAMSMPVLDAETDFIGTPPSGQP